MDNRAIGVFDSGLGGLTAVREIKKVLPNEKILYFGDTGRVPYGTRSAETIAKYARQDINFLLKQDVKMIVAACGTVSSNASAVLDEIPVPHTNIIEPCCDKALEVTRNKKIGVIATSATISSGSFERKLKFMDNSVEVFAKSCPLLVPLVENGFIDRENKVTRLVVEEYLATLRENGVDTIILGCTHYPILKEIIGDIVGDEVKLINSGKEIAHRCKTILEKFNMLSQQNNNEAEFFVSDSVEGFEKTATICLGAPISGNITKIDIEEY